MNKTNSKLDLEKLQKEFDELLPEISEDLIERYENLYIDSYGLHWVKQKDGTLKRDLVNIINKPNENITMELKKKTKKVNIIDRTFNISRDSTISVRELDLFIENVKDFNLTELSIHVYTDQDNFLETVTLIGVKKEMESDEDFEKRKAEVAEREEISRKFKEAAERRQLERLKEKYEGVSRKEENL